MDKKRNFSKKALRDFELIDLAIEYNDQSAFSELMHNYKKTIYFTILKMIKNADDAQDLTNEAFSKAFNKLHKFKKHYRPDIPPLRLQYINNLTIYNL